MSIKMIMSLLGVKKEDSERITKHLEKIINDFNQITPEQVEDAKKLVVAEYLDYCAMKHQIAILAAYIEKQNVSKLN